MSLAIVHYFPQVDTIMKNLVRILNLLLARLKRKNRIMVKRTKNYPCLCEITKSVLLLARISGILPIKSVPGKDIRSCSFVTPIYLISYSVLLQLVYFGYFCFVYSMQWLCSQDKYFEDTEWWVLRKRTRQPEFYVNVANF